MTLDMDQAVRQTRDLLDSGDCIIFEAAIRFENCFIRVDVLEQKGIGWLFRGEGEVIRGRRKPLS